MDQKEREMECAAERRESFRVEDVLPMICKVLAPDLPQPRARILPGFTEDYHPTLSCGESPDQTVSPQVWGMLVQIHERLGLILHKLNLDREGFQKAEATEVSLSTSGVKFSTGDGFHPGDSVEVKILLPLETPVWILAYGKVARIGTRQDGRFDVGVQFFEMEDEVNEAVTRYALKRQRELIRKRKGF